MPKILKLIKDLTWYNKVEKSKEILRLLTTIFLQDAPEDGNIYGRKDGSWRTFVYNDDLENGYIPLSGTTDGNPVTGDIEIKGDNEDYKIFKENLVEDVRMQINFSDNFLRISVSNVSDTNIYSLNFASNGLTVISNGLLVYFNEYGVSSSTDLSDNLLELSYVQKIYVDNQRGKLISLTETEILAIASPEVGRLYYNTTQNHVVYYDGTNWKKISHSNM